MALTEVEEMLLSGLKLYNIGAGKAAMITLILESEEQKIKMLEFIVEHEQATEKELVDEAWKIVRNS